MKLFGYNRKGAVSYAREWAMKRNPRYGNFDGMGGDCTNFASQVLRGGGCPMNYYKYGWYYNHLNDRAPAWTGVEYLYQFLTTNKNKGPLGMETDIHGIEVGDLVQLDFGDNNGYDHSPVVIEIKPGRRKLDKIIIAAHTIDRIDYPLSNYIFNKIRFIHIQGYYQ